MRDWKSRMRNYGLWVALASFVLLMLQNFGVNVDVGRYEEAVNAFLVLMVTIGLINNPTTETKGFGDDKEK